MSRITVFATTAVLLATIFAASSAHAVPILQLYLEGATYDDTTESWVLTLPGSSGGAPIRLWAIGNVAGPGGAGTISDVKLSLAYASTYTDLEVTITGGHTTNIPEGFVDTSASSEPQWVQTVADGSTPQFTDGSDVPRHGIFGEGTTWQEFSLGDFSLTDSPMADFIDAFPDAPTETTGQINVYEISVSNGSGANVHFDLYDSVAAKNHVKMKFAPFSHDAQIVPEPATLIIWTLLGALGISFGWYRKRRTA